VDNKIRYSDFDQTKHLGAEEIMNKVAVMHKHMNEEQRWLMETNRERLPEYAEIAMDLRISVRHRDDYIHKFIGSEFPNIAIKRLLGRSRSAMDNWLDDNIMNYYFSLVAHTASLQSISSFVNGDAITEDKEWKIDRDLIHNAILPLHLGHTHWAAALVIVEEKTILVVDSMGPKVANGAGKIYEGGTRKLKRYLASKTYVDVKEWKLDYRFLQRQPDAENCGVFACMFVKHLCLGIPWVDIKSLTDIRKKMLFEIERGRLLPF